jgi:hypothetical protein
MSKTTNHCDNTSRFDFEKEKLWLDQQIKINKDAKKALERDMKTVENMKDVIAKTKKFKERAIAVHGNKYDYSKVLFVNSKTKITIICRMHGESNQLPDNHIRKKGCSKCAWWDRGINTRYTNDTFREHAQKIHNDLYDYSKVEYNGYNKKIIIICRIHGEFSQTPATHLHGGGCRKCADINGAKKKTFSQETFLARAREKHGDKYDYSKSNYIHCEKKIVIICKQHGEFIQVPSSHLQGYGCKLCADENLSKHKTYTQEVFLKRVMDVHGDSYDYSLAEYNGTNEKIKIICKKHGIFEQTAGAHFVGKGCSMCCFVKKYSKIQIEWLTVLSNKLDINVEHAENGKEHKIANAKYRADGYNKQFNAIFEFNGCYWHGCPVCFPDKHKLNDMSKKTYGDLYEYTLNKEKHCTNNGYKFFGIWECDWNRIKNDDDLINEYIEKIKTKLYEK